MSCSTCTCELIFNPEIEKTARRLRQETRKRKEEQSSTASPGLNLAIELVDSSSDYSSDSEREEDTMAYNRTLTEL